MSQEFAILGVDKTAISKVESDEVVAWAASKSSNLAQDLVKHFIAESAVQVANIELNIKEFPNQAEAKTELMEKVSKARNFLEVLGDLKENKYTHKTRIVITL